MTFAYYLNKLKWTLILLHWLNQNLNKISFLNKYWTGELLNWTHSNWNSSKKSFTLHQQKTILSSKKWSEYLHAWKIRIYFYWILYLKSWNIIAVCVYKQASLQINQLTNDIILWLLEKLNEKNSRRKKMYIIGDFKIDLLKCNTSETVNNFADTISWNLLSPLILKSTRISNSCSALI